MALHSLGTAETTKVNTAGPALKSSPLILDRLAGTVDRNYNPG